MVWWHQCCIRGRPPGRRSQPLDVGDAAEGMCYTPLVIAPYGAGQVVACGLNLSTHCGSTPAAAILMDRLLHDPLPMEPAARAAVLGAAAAPARTLLAEVGVTDTYAAPVLLCDGSDPAVLGRRAIARG